MYVIDRFEGCLAVCEHGGSFVLIDRACLPQNAQEGDILVKEHNGSYRLDETQTELRRERIRRMMNKLI